MRKIREALRLCLAEGLSPRQAGIATGLPRTTVRRYVERAAVGLGWALPPEMDDRALEERLYGRAAPAPSTDPRPVPDWAAVHRELRRKSVTLALLWTEYRAGCPEGFGYTWFTERYRAYAGRLDLVLRQDHRAGEKAFIDFAGQTIPITDPATGEVWQAQLFVAVLGASNHTYAEALPSQELPHWLGAHVRAFEAWGGAPAILVPDNLRSGVTKAHRYEPILNASYAEMAAHYGTAVIPARPRKPRDKAKAEQGVLLTERWIAAALRNRTFFSLAEANRAIAERVAWLNARPFRKLAGSRDTLFAELDGPALRPLPATPYEYAVWKGAKVSIDYHVELDRHYYSVPYGLVGERVDIRASVRTVEVFARGRRVASHPRSTAVGRHTTETAHMPESHRRHLEWTPGRLVAWGEQTGPATGGPGVGHPPQPPPPRAGLPQLSRHLPARTPPRGGAPGSRLRPGAHRRRSLLSQRRLDPERRSRASTHARAAARAGDPHPRQRPRPRRVRVITGSGPTSVTSTRRRTHPMLTGPTLDKLITLNLGGMARALAEQRETPAYAELPFEDRLGLLVDREATERENRRGSVTHRPCEPHWSDPRRSTSTARIAD